MEGLDPSVNNGGGGIHDDRWIVHLIRLSVGVIVIFSLYYLVSIHTSLSN
jgi:hypothetical protein